MKTKKTILSIDTNAKTVKGQAKGFLTGVVYLAPANESGFNACQHASNGCAAACLFTAGRGAMSHVRNARIQKTLFFFKERADFMENLAGDVAAMIAKAKKTGMIPCVRLNGTSDIPWEKVRVGEFDNIMSMFPNVQFYDYTKNPSRMASYLAGEMPKNYSLTFSRSESNGVVALSILKSGGNVAMVFSSKQLPSEYEGFPVVNGDVTDLRFLDPKGCIVGLKAKGKAKKDDSGFVIHV